MKTKHYIISIATIIVCVIMVGFVIKSTHSRSIQTKTIISPQSLNSKEILPAVYTEDGYSLSEEQWNAGVSYTDVIKMDAMPTWSRYDLDQSTSIEILYTEEWTVEGKRIEPFHRMQGEGERIRNFTFGKFVSAGTYYFPEYTLEIGDVGGWHRFADINVPVLNAKELLYERTHSPDCPFTRSGDNPNGSGKPATLVTIGSIEGVSYLAGGAKGCATAVDIITSMGSGARVVTLYKRYDMGHEDMTHTVTDDMKRIIESLRLEK